MRTVVVACQKGGTGKTTTTAALAQAAISQGKKVLAIDLDPQASLSHIVGADGSHAGVYDIFKGKKLAECIQQLGEGHPDIVSPGAYLAGIERDADISRHPSPSVILATAMKPLQGYDLVFIDTPPALGVLLFNALTAATDVLIPLQSDTFGVQSIFQLQETISQVRQFTNPELNVAGAVLTRYSPRTNLARDLKEAIAGKCAELGIPMLQSSIRDSVSVREAQATQQSLYSYAPKSNPAQDYLSFYTELNLNI